ncbi:glycosyltransferase [Desulfovibrio sp. OttesenSCG-928-C14]|nr:glycosyltransferase [Desulfovibrio sp. OttesenSCG-928-C14]
MALDNTLLWAKAIQTAFPGSVLYGPGLPGYNTNDIAEALVQLGGANKFDAVLCISLERGMLGEPLDHPILVKYPSLPFDLRFFPKNLAAVTLPKIYVPVDFWHCTRKEWNRIVSEHGFSYIFTSQVPPFISTEVFDFFFPLAAKERAVIVPWPGGRSAQRYKDYGLGKKYDILMTGAQLPSFYPVRSAMLEAFKNSELSLFSPSHPGYGVVKDNPYPMHLSSSRISAFCGSIFHIIFGKLLEAMASRTAAMCDFLHGAELMGFIADKHYILADGSNCVEKAKLYLNEPGMLEEMYDEAQKIFLTRHTLEKRAEELAEALPALLNHGKALNWAEFSPNIKAVKAHQRIVKNFTLPPEKIDKTHILEGGLSCGKHTWDCWHRLGQIEILPASPHDLPTLPATTRQVVTASSWHHMFKGEYLRNVAQKLQAKYILEIGTGMGFQSFIWANWMLENKVDGRIITTDTIGHDELVLNASPIYMDNGVSRRLLWQDRPEEAIIEFVLRGQDQLDPQLKFDLVYIDQNNTFDSVMSDFNEFKHQMHGGTVLVVNRYTHEHPGVMSAVNCISRIHNMNVKHISFEPAAYGMAVCSFIHNNQ